MPIAMDMQGEQLLNITVQIWHRMFSKYVVSDLFVLVGIFDNDSLSEHHFVVHCFPCLLSFLQWKVNVIESICK